MSGTETLRPIVEELFDSVPQGIIVTRSNVDSKNKFQEFVQANGAKAPPKYVPQQTGGTAHAPEFTSKVYVDGKLYGEGKGRSKKEAEKNAADDALSKLKKRGLI